MLFGQELGICKKCHLRYSSSLRVSDHINEAFVQKGLSAPAQFYRVNPELNGLIDDLSEKVPPHDAFQIIGHVGCVTHRTTHLTSTRRLDIQMGWEPSYDVQFRKYSKFDAIDYMSTYISQLKKISDVLSPPAHREVACLETKIVSQERLN